MTTDKEQKQIKRFLRDHEHLGEFSQKLRQLSDEELLKLIKLGTNV